MPVISKHPSLVLPQSNILSYLYSQPGAINNEPLWLNSSDTSSSLSTRQAVQWIKRLGSGLQRLGLNRGDIVLICTPNHIFVPIAYLGIVGSTCVFSGANPSYTAAEIAHQLSDTGAKVILAHPKKLDQVVEAAGKINFPKDRIYQFSDVVNPVRHGVHDWTTMLPSAEEAESWNWPQLSPQEATKTVATINYSSGTTGLPKGVCISHASLIANVEQSLYMRFVGTQYENPKNRIRERWVAFLPLYHAFGQLYTILMATRLRATAYIMSEFKFEDFLSAIQTYKVTCLQIAPPILVMLSKRPETKNYDLSSLQSALCGAAPLSRELQNDCQTRFNLAIKQGWGMTELTCGAMQVPGGIHDLTGSVGQLSPNSEMKLLDEDGKEVGPDEPGEIYIRGPQVCLGYWRNEKATKETLSSDGWLKTGDIAKYNDDQGLIWIVDRKKELIKVNGLQVAPAELEAALLENEHVADAAVVGITIEGNEWPRAYVVIQDVSKDKVKPSDIQDWIAGRVSKHKQLRGGVTFVDTVPKLPSGKIVRKLMREWAKRDAAEIEKESKARL